MSCRSFWCHINVKIAWTICGVILGIIYCVVYAVWLKNWSAFGVCVVSVLFSLLTLYLYWAYKKNWVVDWKRSTLTKLFWINLLFAIASFTAMLALLIYCGVTKVPAGTVESWHGENLWFTSAWCFLVFKFSFQSAIFSWWMRRQLFMTNIEPKCGSISTITEKSFNI